MENDRIFRQTNLSNPITIGKCNSIESFRHGRIFTNEFVKFNAPFLKTSSNDKTKNLASEFFYEIS